MKPFVESFSLGVQDLLAILLPGLIAELLIWQLPAVQLAVNDLLSFITKDWQWSVAFLSGAYVIGHLLFFAGSFLDAVIYDRVKNRIWNNSQLLKHVTALKKHQLGVDDPLLINNYKWCRAEFLLKYPAVYSVIEGHEASSKFFRSLVVTMIMGLVIFLVVQKVTLGWVCLALAVLALVIYLRLRQKAIRTAYEHMITISGCKQGSGEIPADLAELNQKIGEAEQGKDIPFLQALLSEGIVFRRANETINDKAEFLSALSKMQYDQLKTEVQSIHKNENGKAAMVIAKVTAKGNRDGQPFEGSFKNLRFFHKTDTDNWKLAAWYNEKLVADNL